MYAFQTYNNITSLLYTYEKKWTRTTLPVHCAQGIVYGLRTGVYYFTALHLRYGAVRYEKTYSMYETIGSTVQDNHDVQVQYENTMYSTVREYARYETMYSTV